MANMLSLLDVLPRHERVDIGGDHLVDVFGVSGGDIGKILERYPNAFQEMYQTGGEPSKMDPGLMGAMIAASQRNGKDDSLLGNAAVEARGRSLGVSDQMKLMQAIGRCTFPEGIGPFLESLASTSRSTTEAIELVVRVDSKDQDTGSQPMPKPSEQPDIQQSGN